MQKKTFEKFKNIALLVLFPFLFDSGVFQIVKAYSFYSTASTFEIYEAYALGYLADIVIGFITVIASIFIFFIAVRGLWRKRKYSL